MLVVYYPRKPPFEEISTKSRLLEDKPQAKTTNQIVQWAILSPLVLLQPILLET